MNKKSLLVWLSLSFALVAIIISSIAYVAKLGHSTAEISESIDAPKKPNDWFFMQRSYPEKTINYEAWQAAVVQAQAMREEAFTSTEQWQQAGPTNIGGRITAVAVHPSAPNRIYIGAADGGVWYSENGGDIWIPVFDFNSSLSIGAIAIDPNDPNTIYVGTGEANISADSYPGTGMYKSTDGGASWQFIGLPESYHIGRIDINPQNSQQIFVAASGLLFGKNPERGIYRSTDGGQNWDQVLFVSDSTAAIDVAIDPANLNNVYATMWERIRYPGLRIAGGVSSGIYKSTDGGDNWNLLSNGLPAPSSTVGRIGIDIAPGNPNVIYAIYADHPGYFDGVYKSTNAGNSWSRVNDGALSNIYSSFGWYFGNIYIDPTDENTVYALGVTMYKSTNGGNSWFRSDGNMHVDHHAIWVNPADPQQVIVGNDGGLYISQNGGSGYTHKLGLPISQFYAATVDFNNPERRYGGTQDNGTLRTMTGALDDWDRILGGDGFYVIVDPNNFNTIYAEFQWGNLYKSVNGGSNFSPATNGISGSDRTNWMTPVVMDPNNSTVLYYGSQRLYKTANGASSWSPISNDLSNGPYPNMANFGTITTISVSATNSDVIFAGTDDGNVWMTPDGGANWQQVSLSLPQRWVTRVAVDPTDENTVLVTYSGYRSSEYVGHIYRTRDAGQSWEDISANLPEAPIQVVVIDPDHPDYYYVGTDVGVYVTVNGGMSWSMLGSNLPASGVMDLVLHQPTRTLTAATHGRSMFKIDVSTITAIQDKENQNISADFRLDKIYPNPFNSQVTIEFSLSQGQNVTVDIYDILGRRIANLVDEKFSGGNHQVKWDAQGTGSTEISSGIYLVRISSGNQQIVERIHLVK